MNPILIILNISILILLFFSSLTDLKYRMIRKWDVAILYMLCIPVVILQNGFQTHTTILFIITLTLFIGLNIISHGGFGMGDALVLSALSWTTINLNNLQNYLYILGAISLIYGIINILIIAEKNGFKNIKKTFKQIQTIPISEVKPGMVIAEDNFMRGLTNLDIENYKTKGIKKLTVKKPLPFIPVIFISYLLYSAWFFFYA